MRLDDDNRDPRIEATAGSAGRDARDFPHGSLTNTIIAAAFQVHNVFGAGFLEAVYTNALTVELRSRRVPVERDVAFAVMYRGTSVGRYVADLVVDQLVIVETKAAKAIDAAHRAQVLNYLRVSGLEVGLVVNFGTSVQFKRVVLTSRHGKSRDHLDTDNSNNNDNNNS